MEDEKDEVKTEDDAMKDEDPPASQPRQNMREADEPQSSMPGLTALATTQPFWESYANEDLKDEFNDEIEDEEIIQELEERITTPTSDYIPRH